MIESSNKATKTARDEDVGCGRQMTEVIKHNFLSGHRFKVTNGHDSDKVSLGASIRFSLPYCETVDNATEL